MNTTLTTNITVRSICPKKTVNGANLNAKLFSKIHSHYKQAARDTITAQVKNRSLNLRATRVSHQALNWTALALKPL